MDPFAQGLTALARAGFQEPSKDAWFDGHTGCAAIAGTLFLRTNPLPPEARTLAEGNLAATLASQPHLCPPCRRRPRIPPSGTASWRTSRPAWTTCATSGTGRSTGPSP